MRRVIAAVAASVLAAGALVACGNQTDSGATAGKGDTFTVFATTGYLADAVKNIAPDAEIITMVGPGSDPHTYQPSSKDIQKMRNADLVVWNGLHLEAQMVEQLESLGDKQIAVGDQIPENMLLPWPETDDHGNPLFDPHIWNSPDIWSLVVGEIADKMSSVDSEHADTYKQNATAYQGKIAEMKDKAAQELATIPAEQRLLITGHDAFNYFGKTFDIEVHATDFVSSEAKRSAEEIKQLADLIAARKIPVIFQDNLANPQAITSLKEAVQAHGTSVEISDEELYADSLGESAPVDTYLGVYQHNVDAISAALGK